MIKWCHSRFVSLFQPRNGKQSADPDARSGLKKAVFPTPILKSNDQGGFHMKKVLSLVLILVLISIYVYTRLEKHFADVL